MNRQFNPGNISVRLGAVLAKYEDAVERRDWETADNLTDVAFGYVAVHLKPKQVAQFRSMPVFVYGDPRAARQVFQDVNDRMTWVLARAKENNLFAKTEIEEGDASSLDREDEVDA